MLEDYTPPQKKRRFRWGLLVVVLVGLALAAGTGVSLFFKIKFADFQPPMSAPDVIAAQVASKEFSDRIEAIGTAEAFQSATLTSTVTETIKAITVNEGEHVAVGTVIVELNNEEEVATLNEASRAFGRYDQLARSKIGSEARRDEEQARMNIAQAQLNKRRIVAPFDGVLGIRKVSVGDMVSPGTVITTIDDIDPIKLQFSVPESYLAVVKTGLEIQSTTDAYPGEVFKGTITAVDSRINTNTRAILLNAEIANPDFRLRPGLLMKADIVKSFRQALAVPEQAILSSGDKKSVMAVGSDNKAVEKPVVLGSRQAGYVEIISGLNAGDKVIIEGLQKAHAGGEVKIIAEKTIDETVKDAVGYSVPRKQDALGEAAVPATTPDATTPVEAPPAQTEPAVPDQVPALITPVPTETPPEAAPAQ